MFVKIKARMVSAPVMYLSDFSKIFEVACDASSVVIGRVWAQERQPVASFSEKLNNAK